MKTYVFRVLRRHHQYAGHVEMPAHNIREAFIRMRFQFPDVKKCIYVGWF